jgi:hypothetical protein
LIENSIIRLNKLITYRLGGLLKITIGMSASGQERPLNSIQILASEWLLSGAVSMGRRNTCLKPSMLIFGPEGFVGAS